MTATTTYEYSQLAELMTLMTGDEKHDFSATSTLDALWVLYRDVLHLDPNHPDDPGRDRFLLSKGHGPMAYYAVLAARGFLSPDQLKSFGQLDSPLGYHPDRVRAPGVEISSGSLGHGLGLAVGTALGLRLTGHTDARVVVLTGDAELEEGSNFEAIQFAGRAGLGRLMAIVIDNSSAALGWPGGIASRFELEGWTSVDVDGRDHQQLAAAYAAGHPGRPHLVVAHVERKDA
ncbi:MAG: transketolase [Jatrophihabitantaceae bacterium]